MHKKKALVISSVGRHFHKFRYYDIDILINAGYEVHFASNFNSKIDEVESNKIEKHQINFNRNPISISNIFSLIEVVKLMKNNKYSVIHCQTPIGGIITRIAALITRQGNVIYTAHGFHFYKGSSLFSWIFYFNLEKILSFITKKIVTINNEDFCVAKEKMFSKEVIYCPGVGIDTQKFYPDIKKFKSHQRKKLHIPEECFVILMIGELNNNKNQMTAINAIKILNKNPLVKLIIAGDGINYEKYQKYINDNNLNESISLIGHRNDIVELISTADAIISTSKREGLPVNLLEGMAVGLPIIATDCRGNRDLVEDSKNGFLIPIGNSKILSEKILYFMSNPDQCQKFGNENLLRIQKYSRSNISNIMQKVLLQ